MRQFLWMRAYTRDAPLHEKRCMCIRVLLKSGLCRAPEGALGPPHQHLTLSLAISFWYLTVVREPAASTCRSAHALRGYTIAKPLPSQSSRRMLQAAGCSPQHPRRPLPPFTRAACGPAVMCEENRSWLELFYWRHSKPFTCATRAASLSALCYIARVEVENAGLLKKTTGRRSQEEEN